MSAPLEYTGPIAALLDAELTIVITRRDGGLVIGVVERAPVFDLIDDADHSSAVIVLKPENDAWMDDLTKSIGLAAAAIRGVMLGDRCIGTGRRAIGASVTRDESQWHPVDCPVCGESVAVVGYPPLIAVHAPKEDDPQ